MKRRDEGDGVEVQMAQRRDVWGLDVWTVVENI
jgi:hypothetical protein